MVVASTFVVIGTIVEFVTAVNITTSVRLRSHRRRYRHDHHHQQCRFVRGGFPHQMLRLPARSSFTPPEQSPLLARRLEEAGVEHRLLELPYAQHGFDLSWGGWGSQITRPELERFLEQHLGRQSPKTQ